MKMLDTGAATERPSLHVLSFTDVDSTALAACIVVWSRALSLLRRVMVAMPLIVASVAFPGEASATGGPSRTFEPDYSADCTTLTDDMLDLASQNQCNFQDWEWTADRQTLLNQCVAWNQEYGDNIGFANMYAHDQVSAYNCHPTNDYDKNCKALAQEMADKNAQNASDYCGLSGRLFTSNVATLKAYCDEETPVGFVNEMDVATARMGVCYSCNDEAKDLVSTGELFAQQDCETLFLTDRSVDPNDYLYADDVAKLGLAGAVSQCMKDIDDGVDISAEADAFRAALQVCTVRRSIYSAPSSQAPPSAPRLGMSSSCPPGSTMKNNTCISILIPLVQPPVVGLPSKKTPNSIKLLACPPGQKRDANNNCQTVIDAGRAHRLVTCPAGEELVDGTCAPTPSPQVNLHQILTCADGQLRGSDGQCPPPVSKLKINPLHLYRPPPDNGLH